MNGYPPSTMQPVDTQRFWRCEFNCDGATFIATVAGVTEAEAHARARLRLAGEIGFASERATLVACTEV